MKDLGKTIIRLISFSASTLVGTAVDMLVLWLLSDFALTTYMGEYLLSPFISFECAVLANFVVAYFVIWRDRVRQRSWSSFIRHFVGYNLSCTGGFLIKMCFLLLIEHFFAWDVLLCNLVALMFSGLFNFAMNEWVVFRKKSPDAGDKHQDSSVNDMIEDSDNSTWHAVKHELETEDGEIE